MLTRRQKRSLRAFAAALSCCVLLSGILVYVELTSGVDAEPVVFADILEGARVSADDLPEHFAGNIITVESAALTETMFSEALKTYTRPITAADDDVAHGAGGTLLLNTTPLTSEIPETEPSAPADTSVKETDTTTTAITSVGTEATVPSSDTEITTKRTTARTTAKQTATTSRTTRTTTTTTTTARATARTTTATTKAPVTETAATSTFASIYTEASKAPFINVGGGVMSEDTSVYLALIELVNEARRKAGVKELWYSARLHDVCKTRVAELTSYYSHSRPDGTKFSTAYVEQGISFQICGENIAYGRNMFKTPEEVFNAWMDSRSHRENILYPDYECAAFGLSIIKVGNDTYYYWTQQFAKF